MEGGDRHIDTERKNNRDKQTDRKKPNGQNERHTLGKKHRRQSHADITAERKRECFTVKQ